MTLRELIQEIAKEHGIHSLDYRTEQLAFDVADRWAKRRVEVAEQIRNGTYDPEKVQLKASGGDGEFK